AGHVSGPPAQPELGPLAVCVIGNGFASRRAGLGESPPVNSFRYRLTRGARYALMTTVEVLSYSRYSGRIRLEIEIGTPRRPSASATACSCVGLANEKSSETAIDSISARRRRRARASSSRLVKGPITVATLSGPGATRSFNPNRNSRGISGVARVTDRL